MALSKTSADRHTEVDSIIAPEFTKRVTMGIDPASLSLIIGRLTDIYPNPILSSVREVVSNAIDATVLLPEGERRPVEIHTPSMFNATFTVTDYGVGMSVETVETIYSQYGGSTKRNDFTQFGAYGLGAKAPLAYCNEFTVSTTHEGITTDFIVGREEGGNFTKILSVEKTDKPSGTVISMPSRVDDVREFTNALKSYQEFISDVPLVIDGKLVEASTDYQLLADDFVLDEDSGTVGRVWVSTADHEYLTSLLETGKSDFEVKFVLSGWVYGNPGPRWSAPKNTVVVELKPGVVDFASSRDEITKNPKSEMLLKRIRETYGCLNEFTLGKALAAFRNLPAEDAWYVYKELSLARVPGDDSVVELESGRGRRYSNYGNSNIVKHLIPISAFTTNEGVNFVEFLQEKREPNIYGLVTMTGDKGNAFSYAHLPPDFDALEEIAKGRTLRDKYGVFKSKMVGFGRIYYDGSTLTEISKLLIEDVEEARLVDFGSFLLISNRGLLNGHQRQYNTAPLSRTLITDVDSDFALQFTKNRPLLARTILKDQEVVLAKTLPSEQLLAFMKEIFGFTYEVMTASDVLVKISEERAAAAAAKKELVKSEDNVNITLLTEGFKNDEEWSGKLSYVSTRTNPMKISDLKAENAILLLVHSESMGSSWKTVLLGVANSGVKVNKRRIYKIEGSRLRARHHELLVGYENVFVHPDVKLYSIAGKKILSTQTRSGEALFSDVLKSGVPSLMKLYLENKSINISNEACKRVLAKLPVESTLHEVFTLIMDAKKALKASQQYRKVTEEVLASTLSNEIWTGLQISGEVVRAASYASNPNSYSTFTFSDGLIHTALTATLEDAPESLLDSAFNTFIQRIEEKLLESSTGKDLPGSV